MTSLLRYSLVGLALLAAPRVRAQDHATGDLRGPFVSAHVTAAWLTQLDPRNTTSGPGLELSAGWRFTPRFAVSVTAAGATLRPGRDPQDLGHVDLLAELRPTRGPVFGWRPGLEVGVSGREAVLQPPTAGEPARRHANAGPTVGLALSRPLTPRFSMQLGTRYNWGDLSQVECPRTGTAVRTCARTIRIRAGGQLSLGRRANAF